MRRGGLSDVSESCVEEYECECAVRLRGVRINRTRVSAAGAFQLTPILVSAFVVRRRER